MTFLFLVILAYADEVDPQNTLLPFVSETPQCMPQILPNPDDRTVINEHWTRVDLFAPSIRYSFETLIIVVTTVFYTDVDRLIFSARLECKQSELVALQTLVLMKTAFEMCVASVCLS